jgi:hypothetical protein
LIKEEEAKAKKEERDPKAIEKIVLKQEIFEEAIKKI